MTKDLAANSYYFIPPNANVVQEANGAFGPVQGSETTQYRVTSKFSTSEEVSAYAICSGQVFLQPHASDTSKVNLILRPFKQPVKGLSIKYFIYRGLNKVDFIPTGNTNLVSYNQKDTATEFIKLLWKQLEDFDDTAIAQPFEAKWIGYDPENQQQDTFIDDYFFIADAYGDEDNETLKPFELPIVPAGTELAHFKGDFGLDAVLSDGDYKALSSNTGFVFNLDYARAAECIIDTANVPTGYAEKQYREAIHDFMDPAAFWGLHFSEAGKVYTRDGSSGTLVKKENQQIYNDIVSKFATKNNVYIHLQGHLGRSYNYYDSYTSVIGETSVLKTGTNQDATRAVMPSTNGWPLIIQNEEQNHNDVVNKIYLQFVYQNDGEPILFGEIANLVEGENNFLTADQLIPENTVIENNDPLLDFYTKPATISIPAVGNSATKENIASYVKLLYQGSKLEVTNPDTGGLQLIKPVDTLFGPVNIEQRLVSADQEVISWSSYYKNRLAQTKIIDSKGPNNKIALQTKIIANKIAFEENGEMTTISSILYESQFFEGVSDGLYLNNFPQSEIPRANSVPFLKQQNNTYRLSPPNYIATEFFTDGFTTLKGLRIYNTLKEYPNKFMLGISDEQNSMLKNVIEINKLKNTTMFLSPLSSDGSLFISTENLFYGKYKLGVLSDNELGIPIIYFPDDEIIVYSLDENIYFSKDYSQNILNDSALAFDLTIERTL